MILTTEATGNNGVEILSALSGHNEKIRAMVHHIPDGKESLLPNVQTLVADFDDASTLRDALTGVNRVFLGSVDRGCITARFPFFCQRV